MNAADKLSQSLGCVQGWGYKTVQQNLCATDVDRDGLL